MSRLLQKKDEEKETKDDDFLNCESTDANLPDLGTDNIKIMWTPTPSRSTTKTKSNDDWWIDQVLELQRENHKNTIPSRDEADSQGFVTVGHLKSDLKEMTKFCPQFLAVVVNENSDGNDEKKLPNDPQIYPKIIGYSLTVDKAAMIQTPSLEKLYKDFFDMMKTIVDANSNLTKCANTSSSTSTTPSLCSIIANSSWVLGAQVCVAKGFRRKGILRRLYDAQVEQMAILGFPVVVTAVDKANVPSLRAHEKAGFEVLETFPTGGRDNTGWYIIGRQN